MQKFIQPIATIMIVLLLVVLVWIFLGYYKGYENVETMQGVSSGDIYVSNSNSQGNENKERENIVSSIISTPSGDNQAENNNGQNSNSNSSENNGQNTIPNVTIYLPEDSQKPTEIISSNTETSSQEKQEVLSEIDEALKDLLEAVGKVEIVDEARLDATLEQGVESP